MRSTLFVTMLLAVVLGRAAESQSPASTEAPQITATSPEFEQRDQPVTADDVAIIAHAEALLSSAAVWNRADERECKDDEATGKRSLFCALEKACIDVLGNYDHRRVALQEVRFAVADATRGRAFEHRLRDFNNLPETRFEDVKRVLAVAKDRVRARLKGKISVPAVGRPQSPTPPSLATRDERQAFLSNARFVTDAPADGRPSWRASLAAGALMHDAAVDTADGSGPTRRHYKLNLAAYALDTLLDLHLVPPSVERSVNGRSASVSWWLDDVAMSELDRRRKAIDPPDPDSWSRQVQAVRVFDELISNTYRDTAPPLYLNSVWDNLLITTGWTIWITDHTGAFRTRHDLQDPESLIRCPRVALARLRRLSRGQLQQTLQRYLSPLQLDALEVRRVLLVRHYDRQIKSKGEAAVLYDLPPR